MYYTRYEYGQVKFFDSCLESKLTKLVLFGDRVFREGADEKKMISRQKKDRGTIPTFD